MYQNFVCGLRIGDEDYTVHSKIAVDLKGNRYYDHNLVNIEKGKLLDQINEGTALIGFGTTPDNKSTTNYERKYRALVDLLQTKILENDGNAPIMISKKEIQDYDEVFTNNEKKGEEIVRDAFRFT